MPELTLHSIPSSPPPPLPDPTPEGTPEPPAVAATPPEVDPDAWETFPAFRETFLMYLTPPGYADTIRKTGEVLYSLILDTPAEWPGWPESSTRTEMRAALADLRHLQGFLAAVGREREVSSLDPEDAYLSNTAARLARQIKHAADGIERELDGAPGAEPEGVR
jgi:hypothetical protein